MAFRSRLTVSFQLRCVAQASLVLTGSVICAQVPDAQLITITGKGRGNSASVAGFGDLPLASAPFSATVITTGQLQDAGIGSIGDLTRLDAGATDAYNAPGYWGQLAVRGYTLDNRFNYRRDGLPINAETAIASANKQALEILKGTSGLQAGTSAPGGLVNLVVKRPERAVRSATLHVDEPGSWGVSIDIGDRVGVDESLGWRINAALDQLDPPTHNSRGKRHLLAAAVDARLGRSGLLEAEFELSRQSQPSTPGFSLLGSRLPDASAIDPRINLNNQPWTLPVVFEGRTASLRYTLPLSPGADLVAHGVSQQLRTDDRIAFPFGCSAEDNYTRYCSDGSFDFYDFRSERERRDSMALDVHVAGRTALAGMTHRYKVGVLNTRFDARLGRQAYNYVGSGTVDGRTRLGADPALTDENTNRRERSTELHLQDVVTLTEGTRLWGGLRHTRLQRESMRTDGSRATDYTQSFSTPWLALSQALGDQGTAYLSWGQGVESEVAPNRSRYANAGQSLPSLKSRQVELGYKHSGSKLDWRVAAFDIVRPQWRDIGSCSTDGSCVRQLDGSARHSGLEAEAEWRQGAFSLRGSALALRAHRAGSQDASLNGQRPTNVPASSLKLQAAYNLQAVPELALLAFVTHEGPRMVLPDNSVATAGWTGTDLGIRYTQRPGGGTTAIWRVGMDNVFDRRAWKEAPYQYDHAYLYPLAPRNLHASVSLDF